MNVLLFGATGMGGQGVLREYVLDPGVQLVKAVGRTATGVTHARLQEVVHQCDCLYLRLHAAESACPNPITVYLRRAGTAFEVVGGKRLRSLPFFV